MLAPSTLECVITLPRVNRNKFQKYMASNPHATLFLTDISASPYLYTTLIYAAAELKDCEIFQDAAKKCNISHFSVEITGIPIDICHEMN